ncbi:MAG: nitrate ABC transporter substrate-binding protein [Methylobacterium sp.]|nr:MAG: nitrate ABC transporter substrate-binding protein [Methylobacterium sp.]
MTTRYLGRHVSGTCPCGAVHETVATGVETAVDEAIISAVFPRRALRREVLKAIGSAGLLAALADILPLSTLKAIAQERAPLEKANINVGFLPITCATPLIMGFERGIFSRNGLNVSLQKIPGIGLIRDKMINGELDVSQQVMPVALATSAGVGGTVVPTKVLTILNQHGNSLVLAMKHRDNRDPKNWKGFRFAIPFEQSHQALQLRHYLAEAGLDPDKDVVYRVVPPTEYVSNLRVGSIDGFFGGEPGGQRAVVEGAGFIHLISKEIWEGHPCCSVTATDAWIKQNPNTFMAVFRSVIEAGIHASKPENRAGMSKVLAQTNYLNAPEGVIEQVIGGRFADGLGNIRTVPDRVNFDPFPHYSMAVWLTTQMRRWNMISTDLDHRKLAERVMLATDARRLMAEQGVTVTDADFRRERILGREFDSNDPDGYLRTLPNRG